MRIKKLDGVDRVIQLFEPNWLLDNLLIAGFKTLFRITMKMMPTTKIKNKKSISICFLIQLNSIQNMTCWEYRKKMVVVNNYNYIKRILHLMKATWEITIRTLFWKVNFQIWDQKQNLMIWHLTSVHCNRFSVKKVKDLKQEMTLQINRHQAILMKTHASISQMKT